MPARCGAVGVGGPMDFFSVSHGSMDCNNIIVYSENGGKRRSIRLVVDFRYEKKRGETMFGWLALLNKKSTERANGTVLIVGEDPGARFHRPSKTECTVHSN